jgi:hypothetical protein
VGKVDGVADDVVLVFERGAMLIAASVISSGVSRPSSCMT